MNNPRQLSVTEWFTKSASTLQPLYPSGKNVLGKSGGGVFRTMRRRALIKRVRIGVFIAWRSLLFNIHMANVLADNLLKCKLKAL